MTILINEIIRILNSYPYVILRNWEELPETISNDVDILIESKDKVLLIKDLKKSLSVIGWVLYNRAQFSCESFFFYHKKSLKTIHIDLFTSLEYKGISYIDCKKILKNRVLNKNGVYIPDAVSFAQEVSCMNSLYKRPIKKTYIDYIVKHSSVESLKYLIQLTNLFTKESSVYFFSSIYTKLLISSKKHLFLSLLKKNKLSFVRYLVTLSKKVMKPKGLYISFLGVDGSGKTTLIKNLKTECESLSSSKIVHEYHFCPSYHYNKNKLNIVVSDPHKESEYNYFLNLMKLAFLYAQFIGGYFKNIFPKKVTNRLIINDRYFDDLLIDPKRLRMRNLPKLYKFVRFFLPLPDLYVIVHGDSIVIQKRKKELSVDQTKKIQKKLFDAFAENKKAVFINSTELSLTESIHKIKRTLLVILADRENG